MYKRIILSTAVLLAALCEARTASATGYTVACGTGGNASVVQAQLNAIGSSPNNSVTVTGTCVGDVTITAANQLILSGLSLNGSLTLDSTVLTSISGLNLTGYLTVLNARRANFNSVVMNGEVDVLHESQVTFSTLTLSSWSDSAGVHDPSFNCTNQSDCNIVSLSLTGSGTGGGTGNSGLLAASSSRLTVFGGTISGFDIGVQVWNNSMVFLTPSCASLNVVSNISTGVYSTDGGIAKIEGQSAADAASAGCSGSGPSRMTIAANGRYGVLADGGGNAYLYQTSISGHTLDGIRVQHGSTARVRSSTIDAATSSGRSARVMSQAHLFFDEQMNGPAASSTLAGPVCVTDSSSVDTYNSSTVLNTVTTCTSP